MGTAAQGATAPLWEPLSTCFWESRQLPGGLRDTGRDWEPIEYQFCSLGHPVTLSSASLCVVQIIAPTSWEIAGRLKPRKSHGKPHLVVCCPQIPGVGEGGRYISPHPALCYQGLRALCFFLLPRHFQWGIHGQRRHRKEHSLSGVQPTLPALLPQDMRALGLRKTGESSLHSELASAVPQEPHLHHRPGGLVTFLGTLGMRV